jgi:hypothetical protein
MIKYKKALVFLDGLQSGLKLIIGGTELEPQSRVLSSVVLHRVDQINQASKITGNKIWLSAGLKLDARNQK